jgi:hypothetical protein
MGPKRTYSRWLYSYRSRHESSARFAIASNFTARIKHYLFNATCEWSIIGSEPFQPR